MVEAGVAEDAPEWLVCPVTREVFRDPVFVPSSGTTYEREALERYWATRAAQGGRPRDPFTNVELRSREVFTNWDVRRGVARYLESLPAGVVPEGWASREVPPPVTPWSNRLADFAGAEADARAAAAAATTAAMRMFAQIALAASAALADASPMRTAVWLAHLALLPPPAGGEVSKQRGAATLAVAVAAAALGVYGLPPEASSLEDNAAQLSATGLLAGLSLATILSTALCTYSVLEGGAPILFVALFVAPFWSVGAGLAAQAASQSWPLLLEACPCELSGACSSTATATAE